ncbi:MAG: PAS domain-containing protein [Gammaproteobacteria bacterium]|nr:PAS domain-containing protein [Gammaproteobacteria bacterium]
MDAGLLTLISASCAASIPLFWIRMRNEQRALTREITTLRKLYDDARTERKQAAEPLPEYFDAAPECVKIQDADGKVCRINAAGLALLETIQPLRIVGRSVYEVIAPEYHDAYRALTRKVFDGTPAMMEFELLTFLGNRRWLETHAVPLRDADGKVTRLLAITRDIDDRKHMQRLLEEQRNRLQTIIQSEPECVKLQNRQGVITEMNPAGLSLLQASDPEQVVGHSIYEFLDPLYHDAYRQLTTAVFDGSRDSLEFEVRTIAGQRRWLETHATPLNGSDGRPAALLAITRDIDARKKSEEKLRRQRNELAHLCRLGTLGELATGLAHELSQPLCALSSYAESALAVTQLPSVTTEQRVADILQKIVRESERANATIERLRELVRKRKPKSECCKPHDLVHEAIDIVDAEIRRHAIDIDVDMPEPTAMVSVDRVQSVQVLLNLLTNAIRAIADNASASRQLTLRLTQDGACVTIEVVDQAGGIPAGSRDRLFSPFFTTKTDGIGLGLSLSRRLAEANGGSLDYVASENGSRFRYTLPCAGCTP